MRCGSLVLVRLACVSVVVALGGCQLFDDGYDDDFYDPCSYVRPEIEMGAPAQVAPGQVLPGPASR
jgi:hypothetical protein